MHLKSLRKSERHEHCVAALCDILQACPKRSVASGRSGTYVGAGRVGRRNGLVGSCVAVGISGSASGTAVADFTGCSADPTGIVSSSKTVPMKAAARPGLRQGRSRMDRSRTDAS
jgi:hypothetical protein